MSLSKVPVSPTQSVMPQRVATFSILQRILCYPLMSLILLFFPSWIAVTQANTLANHLFDPLSSSMAQSLEWLAQQPTPFAEILGGDYGVVAMLPFLLLYALPTIVFFTLLIGFYRSTGLMEAAR